LLSTSPTLDKRTLVKVSPTTISTHLCSTVPHVPTHAQTKFHRITPAPASASQRRRAGVVMLAVFTLAPTSINTKKRFRLFLRSGCRVIVAVPVLSCFSCQCRHAVCSVTSRFSVSMLLRCHVVVAILISSSQCRYCRASVPVQILSYCGAVVISLRIAVPMLVLFIVPLPSARLGQGLGVINHQSERARKTV